MRERFARTVQKVRATLVLAFVAIVALASAPLPERIGDNVQIALPLAGFACSIANGAPGAFFERAVILTAAIHGPRNMVGDHPWNARPDGGSIGMISGHAAAATFGTTALLTQCITALPWVRVTLIITTGFVAVTRVESERHYTWQVLAGVLVGLFVALIPGGRLAPRAGRAIAALARRSGLAAALAALVAPLRRGARDLGLAGFVAEIGAAVRAGWRGLVTGLRRLWGWVCLGVAPIAGAAGDRDLRRWLLLQAVRSRRLARPRPAAGGAGHAG